jgi:hypothetical protein
MRQTTVQIFNNGSSLFNNGRVAISKDLIFGLSVFVNDAEGFLPCSELDSDDLEMIARLIDFDPLFQWKDEFAQLRATADKKVPV